MKWLGRRISCCAGKFSSMVGGVMKHSLHNSDRLVIDHLNFARQFARQFCRSLPSHVDVDAVESDALLGLILAARAFDPLRGVIFTTYAKRRIRGAILDGLRERQGRGQRQHMRFVSLSTPMGDEVTLGDVLADRGLPVDSALEQTEEIARLLRPARRVARRLVREHFIEGYSQEEIARRHGLSPSRVSQLIHEARKRIREMAEAN